MHKAEMCPQKKSEAKLKAENGSEVQFRVNLRFMDIINRIRKNKG